MRRPKPTLKNLDAVPTWKIGEILDSVHCTGTDGADYAPVREELQSYYWARLNTDSEREQHQWQIAFKAEFKHRAQAHKHLKGTK